MNATYLKAGAEAQRELTQLEAQRADLDRRILRLKQTIATLYRLTLGEAPDNIVNRGLTDAIRELVGAAAESGKAATAKDVKESLETLGYDFSNYKNPIASINGTLQRMVDQGEARKVKARYANGKKTSAAYTMAPPPKVARERKALKGQ